jgi:branched-chain amino acid transport system ATP-binding protein
MKAPLILKTKLLCASYGAIGALNDISIEIPDGSITTLVGSNGAGKTTLLRCLSGVMGLDCGKIEYCGEDIGKLSAAGRVRSGIAHVPEGRQVWPAMSVQDNLLLGAYLQRDKSEIQRTLAEIYAYFPVLKDKSAQAAGTLSGGQQQMLAIGRAMMSKPKLLLLDEPSMGLAPLIVKDVFNVIRRLNEAGVSVMLVEQNANAALAIADYAYVLESGRIVLQGTGKEMADNSAVKAAYLGM